MCGFLQSFAALNVEIANIGVLCGAADTINIVFNFIALAIIAEFDNYVFESLQGESFRLLIEKKFTKRALEIEHTTSKKCKETELSEVKDELGEFRPLRIVFQKRSKSNKILYTVYKVLKTFYVSFFYYFMPFTAIIMSTLVPLLARENAPYNCDKN